MSTVFGYAASLVGTSISTDHIGLQTTDNKSEETSGP